MPLTSLRMVDASLMKRLEDTAKQFDEMTNMLGDPELSTADMLRISKERAGIPQIQPPPTQDKPQKTLEPRTQNRPAPEMNPPTLRTLEFSISGDPIPGDLNGKS